jgi:hypothetical protein
MSLARLTVTTTALIALLAFAGGASASHQEGQGSPRDFAVGTGMNQIGRVSFAAHGGPPPEPVTGHFHAKGEFPPGNEFNIEGPVTCLTVTGRDAGLFYPVRNPDRPGEPDGVFIFLRDNGNTAQGDPRDEIGFLLAPPELIPVQPACPFLPLVPRMPIDRGNFTIHDGS